MNLNIFSQFRSFVVNSDIPIGYKTPPFPSLYWPINNDKYSLAFLYNVVDIWKFTLCWTLILNGAFYGIASIIATITHKKKFRASIIIIVYLLYAGIQSMIIGTVMGFLIGAIYNSGLFAMSTWIPLCCAVAQILYDVVISYSNVITIL